MNFKSLILCAALMACEAMAHDHQAAIPSQTMPGAQAIEHSMKKLFDKPDAPLAVAPVSIEGDYAVAGWIQSGKGGRALLKKEKGQWSIQVCGGDGLTQTDVLAKSGMSPQTAEALSKKVKTAEAKLSNDHLKKLGMFEGMIKVDPTSHDGHDVHHKH